MPCVRDYPFLSTCRFDCRLFEFFREMRALRHVIMLVPVSLPRKAQRLKPSDCLDPTIKNEGKFRQL